MIALNEKLQVFNDLQRDVAENQKLFKDSESIREELQVKITQIGEQVKEDTEMKEKYQSSLLNEIEQLKAEIQSLKRKASADKQAHI